MNILMRFVGRLTAKVSFALAFWQLSLMTRRQRRRLRGFSRKAAELIAASKAARQIPSYIYAEVTTKDIDAMSIVEVRERLAAGQKELHEIFAEAGPDVDLRKVKKLEGDTTAKAAEIKRRNTELEALGKRHEVLYTAEANELLGKRLNDPISPFIQPSGGKDDGLHAGQWGSAVVGHKDLQGLSGKALIKALERGVELGFNKRAVLSALGLKTDFTTSAGWAPESLRTGRVEFFPTRPVAVIDYVPIVPTKMAAVKYMEETTFTSNAAEIAENAAYPEAVLVYTERSKPVQKIGDSLPVTDEEFEDVDGLEGVINNRLQFMVRQRVDSQILVGNATPPNLEGTENVSGIQTQAKGADTTEDAIYKLFVLIRSLGFAEPDVTFINPTKFQDVRLRKTADGIYIYGSPVSPDPDMIWGVRLLQTVAHTSTKAIAGAYRVYSEFRLKRDLEVKVGYINDDFTKGKAHIRADMRGAMVHYRPKAFGVVTGL